MSDSLTLTSKVAIITGSAKPTGIGAGIALTLAHAGAHVVINYVSDSSAEDADATVNRIQELTNRKDSAIVVRADIGTPEGAKVLVDGTLAGFGVNHIDIIVNNAAAGKPGPILSVRVQDLHRSFGVNVFGPVYILQQSMPYMTRGGRVINIGSVASKLGPPGTGIYGAAKAAIDVLTYTLAQEIGRDGKGLTINTVMPGPVPTAAVSHSQIQAVHERLKMITRAEDRLGTVEDIADVVHFLASEKSRWVTGQVISVSGGITGGI